MVQHILCNSCWANHGGTVDVVQDMRCSLWRKLCFTNRAATAGTEPQDRTPDPGRRAVARRRRGGEVEHGAARPPPRQSC
eukprot:486387-Pyramimonas_sp.AAC.1